MILLFSIYVLSIPPKGGEGEEWKFRQHIYPPKLIIPTDIIYTRNTGNKHQVYSLIATNNRQEKPRMNISFDIHSWLYIDLAGLFKS